ncbi:MAG: sensor histidine kinase [Sphaerochaeta sp.]
MIKTLQRRFISVAMAAMSIVILIIALIINVSVYVSSNTQLNKMADYLLDNGGSFPDRFYLQTHNDLGFDVSIESKYETRFFSAKVDEYGNILDLDLDNIAEITDSEAQSYIQNALKKGSKHGYISHYKFAVKQNGDDTLLVFINASQILRTISDVRSVTVLIAAVGLLILLLLIIALSNKAIQPYIDNIERQRQFVMDAGHEIKTPLAVISADVEVIEMANGESDWTKSIKGQIIRLDGLIKQLLSLSKLENISNKDESTVKIDFSSLTVQLCSDFKGLASSKHSTIEMDVDEGITILGQHDKIEQLISLLVENATKYAKGNGIINVSLKANKKHATFKITNQCEGISNSNLANLFERFYRGDKSHNNIIEGYGIGLSVAQAIAASHKGKIIASLNDDETEITFTVILPVI